MSGGLEPDLSNLTLPGGLSPAGLMAALGAPAESHGMWKCQEGLPGMDTGIWEDTLDKDGSDIQQLCIDPCEALAVHIVNFS